MIYPGLESHPGHEVAKRQMTGFSGMISFELKGGIRAGKTVMNRVKLCSLAESLGSVETMITHPATMTHAEVPRAERLARGLGDGIVRLSVGIEHKDDIIQDLKQALTGGSEGGILSMKRLRVAILGFGTVGQGLSRNLAIET